MLGNLSIRSKLLALLAVPVAGTALLSATGLAATAGERSRAAEERRVTAVIAQVAAAVHELQEERAPAAAKEASGQERTLLAASSPAPAGRGSRARAGEGPEQALRVRLAAAAAVARGELNGVRGAAGDRLAEVDLTLGTPGVRRLRRLELALLEPAARPAAVAGDLGVWRAGLAARTAALRRLERTVAGGPGAASGAWLGHQERRLRDQLVLAGRVALVTLAAAVLLGRGLGGRDRRAPAGAVLGLAGRGRVLAERQLQLLRELASDEPDPRRRQGLLGTDHLAGRLRRNAETLLAMAGPEPARPGTGPQSLAEALRAAVAEAEPGGPRRDGRVDLLVAGEVAVRGPAAVDLVHLLAELLDNAAAHSSPAAPSRSAPPPTATATWSRSATAAWA